MTWDFYITVYIKLNAKSILKKVKITDFLAGKIDIKY